MELWQKIRADHLTVFSNSLDRRQKLPDLDKAQKAMNQEPIHGEEKEAATDPTRHHFSQANGYRPRLP